MPLWLKLRPARPSGVLRHFRRAELRIACCHGTQGYEGHEGHEGHEGRDEHLKDWHCRGLGDGDRAQEVGLHEGPG